MMAEQDMPAGDKSDFDRRRIHPNDKGFLCLEPAGDRREPYQGSKGRLNHRYFQRKLL